LRVPPQHRRCATAAVSIALAIAFASGRAANAQTDDYFATPWVVAPVPSQITNPGAPGTTSASVAPSSTRSSSNLYSQALANQAPSAPPVLYSLNIGIDEIGTDNIADTETDRKADLSSLFSAGGTITADTERLSGVLAATGIYQRDIRDTSLDQFSGYGYANAQATVLPSHVYMSVFGAADDLSSLGGGVQSPLVQSAINTHYYTVGGSPYLVFGIDRLGLDVLRYQIGQSWFSTPAIPINPFFPSIGQPSSATDQSAREDFKIAGTILRRLMSDVSLSANEDNAGSSPSGNFEIANGELINEYEVTRYASLIAGGGYEYLHDPEVPIVDGQGEVWDFGGRLRPDADSYVLLVYGHHDRKSDFSGELAWHLTPSMNFYASYTDSLSTLQQSVVASTAGSVLGPGGAVTGVNFDQSPIIGVLDDTLLNAAPGAQGEIAPVGVPLGTGINSTPAVNGIFRSKILSGSANWVFDGNPIALTAYDVQQISLTPLVVPSFAAEGGDLSWSPQLWERLTAFALVGYAHELGGLSGDLYNGAVGANYSISDTLTLDVRYDIIRREGTGGFLQNAVTLGLHKTFY
jgi:hypothetical protein